MRELERNPHSPRAPASEPPRHVAVIGAGRLGTVLVAGLRDAGLRVDGPLRRDAPVPVHADVVILAVPDTAIGPLAARLAPGPLLGHCSGATDLGVLGDRAGFSLHPLMTIGVGAHPRVLRGASAAIAGTDPRAEATARALADALGLQTIVVADEDRAAYHAAASIAANYLVTLEAAAERLAAGTGVPRAALVPLVRAAVENWSRAGAEAALTGPVARGDEATVARQRAAIAQRAPELTELFDVLTAATRSLAARPRASAPVSEAAPC